MAEQQHRTRFHRNADDVGIRAAVVSDDNGFLLGGVGDGDLDALAAVGSMLADGHEHDEARLCAAFGLTRTELHTQRIELGAQAFVITSVGARLAASARVGEMLDRLLMS